MSVSSTSVNNQAALMYVKQRALTPGQDSSGLGGQPASNTATAGPGIDPTSATQIASSFLAALTQFSAGQGFGTTGTTDPTTAASAGATPDASDDIQSLLTELNQSLQGSSGDPSSSQQTTADGSSGSTAAKPAHHHGGHHAHAAPPASETATASTDAATASASDTAATDTTTGISLG